MKEKIENFERAFTDGGASCRATCQCGRTFFTAEESGWSWEEGEHEELRKDPKATMLDHAPGGVLLEGTNYVADCDCWHDRAKRIIGFLEAHGGAIAHWFKLEKARKQLEADNSPTIE